MGSSVTTSYSKSSQSGAKMTEEVPPLPKRKKACKIIDVGLTEDRKQEMVTVFS